MRPLLYRARFPEPISVGVYAAGPDPADAHTYIYFYVNEHSRCATLVSHVVFEMEERHR